MTNWKDWNYEDIQYITSREDFNFKDTTTRLWSSSILHLSNNCFSWMVQRMSIWLVYTTFLHHLGIQPLCNVLSTFKQQIEARHGSSQLETRSDQWLLILHHMCYDTAAIYSPHSYYVRQQLGTHTIHAWSLAWIFYLYTATFDCLTKNTLWSVQRGWVALSDSICVCLTLNRSATRP